MFHLPVITHPTGKDNLTSVEVGTLTLWFSYSTCVAFAHPTTGIVCQKNTWGPTTGKHLNWIDNSHVETRVDAVVFEDRLQALLESVGPFAIAPNLAPQLAGAAA